MAFNSHSDVNKLRHTFPDNKVHGTNMGPTWVLSAPDGPPTLAPWNLLSGLCGMHECNYITAILLSLHSLPVVQVIKHKPYNTTVLCLKCINGLPSVYIAHTVLSSFLKSNIRPSKERYLILFHNKESDFWEQAFSYITDLEYPLILMEGMKLHIVFFNVTS